MRRVLLVIGIASSVACGHGRTLRPATSPARPHLEVRADPSVLVRPAEVHATAELRGAVDDGWLCPLESWGCYRTDGVPIARTSHGEAPCSRDVPQLVFTWAFITSEQCDLRLRLESATGRGTVVSPFVTVYFAERR